LDFSKGIRSDGTQSYTKNAQSYTENRTFFSFFSAKLRDFSVNLCVTERLLQKKEPLKRIQLFSISANDSDEKAAPCHLQLAVCCLFEFF